MNRVQEFRTALNISKRRLSIETGISRTHLIEIESGKSNPSVLVAAKLAKYFGVRMDTLFPCDIELPNQRDWQSELQDYIMKHPDKILCYLTDVQQEVLFHWLEMVIDGD